MKNLNVLIMGQIGSGKTQYAKRLLKLAPRAIVLDPLDDYENGAIFDHDFDAAVDFFSRNIEKDYHLIYRYTPGDGSTEAWLDMVFRSQKEMDLKPIALFLEESSFHSTTHNIGQHLSNIYTKGRRQLINTVTIVQRDTQINPIIRANSHVWISLRQFKVSGDVRETFLPAQQDRLPDLETLTPEGEPVEDRHYVVVPPDFDVFGEWRRHVS